MKGIVIAATLYIAGMTSAAPAQSIPDDVRCFMLSNGFAKGASDEKGRQLAASSLAFFLGRLDGRASPNVIADIVRKQNAIIDPKTAGLQMKACVTRMLRSGQAMEALGRSLTKK